VLKGSSDLLVGEEGPDVSLKETVGVLGPDGEVVGVGGVDGGDLVEDVCEGEKEGKWSASVIGLSRREG